MKYLIGVLIGAAAGLLYYFLIGCNGGTCPITSNPLYAAVYGAIIGALVASLFNTKKKNDGHS